METGGYRHSHFSNQPSVLPVHMAVKSCESATDLLLVYYTSIVFMSFHNGIFVVLYYAIMDCIYTYSIIGSTYYNFIYNPYMDYIYIYSCICLITLVFL